MSAELKRVRRELEVTKTALKAQAVRWRQLVAAFARKLKEKETELRASHDLRDQQLACVLRSLLTLESKLRKEQKQIRQQLIDKDQVIEKQSRELAALRRLSPELVAAEYKIDGDSETVDGDSLNGLVPNENAYRDNPVLESVQQILLRDEEDLLADRPVDHGDKASEGVGAAWYETDTGPVTEQGQAAPPPWPEVTPRISGESGAWCIKVIEAGEEAPFTPGHDRLWVKDKTSPPTKAQHMEEKACLQMAKKTLTIAVEKDLKEVEANSITVLESCYQELAPVSAKPIYNMIVSPQKPPALPPKPSKLLKPSEILKRAEVFTKPQVPVKPRVHVQEMKRKQMNGHVPGNAKMQPSLHEGPALPAVRQKTTQPISIVTVNGDNNHMETTKHKDVEIVGKKENVSPESGNLPTVTSDRIYFANGLKPLLRPEPQMAVNKHLVKGGGKQNETSPSPETDNPTEGLRNISKHEVGNGDIAIRMCRSVSSLITGESRDTIVTELISSPGQENSKLSECSSDGPLAENFEEFKLEESYVDSTNEADGRPAADGAEVSHYAVHPAPAAVPRTYETFLETTGLSQKSILTPSRMLSNHRSCLKPKDVKHRNKVKAAAVGLGPTVKYWTEPYL